MTASPKLLIIDDDTGFRRMISQAFAQAGYEVYQASDGIEGLSAAQVEGGFTAIITDLKMPKMDGLEVIKKIKKIPADKGNGPIFALSSISQDYIKDEVLRTGAKALFLKDEFLPNELVTTITNMTKNNQ